MSNGFKVSFFPNGKHFNQFIEKFFEEMKYRIHHVKFEIWPALCKFSILFSAVKVKLGHNFPIQLYVQNWDFWFLDIGYISKFFPIHKEIENWDFWMLL